MEVHMSHSDVYLFDDWDQVNDWTRRAPEELCEAALALHHEHRGKITPEDAIDEMADAIIAATHAAWKLGGITELNAAIERKLLKAREQAPQPTNRSR